jgi:acyl carrier protein
VSEEAVVSEWAQRLAARMADLTGIDVTEMPAGLDSPLRALEIDSLVFVDFLVATEEEYGFEWDEDTPPEAFETLSAMARAMVRQRSGASVQREAR